jgi:hypothetical protein
MILRLWRGWPATDQAEAYQRLLLEEIAPAIHARDLPGLHDLTVLRRLPRELDGTAPAEVLTAMRFADLDAVSAFTGGDPGRSVVPTAARRLLARFDEHSQHYEVLRRFGRPS